jgi:hypothetical protein
MVIEYRITPEDQVAFNLYHFRHSPSSRRLMLVGRVGFALLAAGTVIGLLTLLIGKLVWVADIPAALIAALIVYALYPWSVARTLQQRVRKALSEGSDQSMMGTARLTLTPDALLTETNKGDSRLRWTAVERIVAADAYDYLYVSAINAIIIPRTAFPNETQRQTFLALVQQYRDAVRLTNADQSQLQA